MSLDPLESFAGSLIATLEPKARRELARDIAQLLRGNRQRSIAAQQNPDGSAFEPRKPQLRLRPGGSGLGLRGQKGKVRRGAMFQKLRTGRYLKAQGTPDAAIVTFTAEVQRIARVHQEGLRDRVNRRGLEVTYPARRLLGINDADETEIRDLIVARLADRL